MKNIGICTVKGLQIVVTSLPKELSLPNIVSNSLQIDLFVTLNSVLNFKTLEFDMK